MTSNVTALFPFPSCASGLPPAPTGTAGPSEPPGRCHVRTTRIRPSVATPASDHGWPRPPCSPPRPPRSSSQAGPAFAASTTLYASPSGSGTACSASQPCSITQAKTNVRALNNSMTGDITVELADGTYRLTAPLSLHLRRLRHRRPHGDLEGRARRPPGHHRRAEGHRLDRAGLGQEHLEGQRRHRLRHAPALRRRRPGHQGPHRGHPLGPDRDHQRLHLHQQLAELPQQPRAARPDRDPRHRFLHRPLRPGDRHQQRHPSPWPSPRGTTTRSATTP